MATILIVDDSSFHRTLVRKILHDAGYATMEAGNGEEALARVAERRPDCVLADLIMPEMRGTAMIEILSRQAPDLPVVVLTADIQEVMRKHCLELGARAVLHKPVKPGDLISCIQEILATRPASEVNINPRMMDGLAELMNIGVGRAASMLNQMLGSPIALSVPSIRILRASDLPAALGRGGDEVLSFVRLAFGGPIQGTAALVFPPDSAVKLVSALTGEAPDTPDLDAVRAGTLSEIGNIVINGVMGSLGNVLHVPLSYGLPSYLDASIDHLFDPRTANPVVLLAQTCFTVEDRQVSGTVLVVFEVLAFDALLKALAEAGLQT